MARPKSEETKAKEAAIAALPVVDVVEAMTKFLDGSIFDVKNDAGETDLAYIKGAQLALNTFKDSILEMRTKFDETLSARRANLGADYLGDVPRFRKERDDSPKAAKPTALSMLGLVTTD